MKTLWLRGALLNISAIHEYYVTEGVTEEGRRQVIRIRKTAEQLQRFPELGRPGRVKGTKELSVTNSPFLLIYRIGRQNIEILRVLHTSQRWP